MYNIIYCTYTVSSCVVPCALINSSRDKSSGLYTVHSTHIRTYNTHVRGYIIMIRFIYYIILYFIITKHTRFTIDVENRLKSDFDVYEYVYMLRLRYSVFGQYRRLENNIIIINSLAVVVTLSSCCTRRHTICVLRSVACCSSSYSLSRAPPRWCAYRRGPVIRSKCFMCTNERPTDRLYRWRPRRIISSRRSRGLFIIIIIIIISF
ncbi:unnamed protein product [Aphis gossypii]|uniref:Uncharacterized protein n=1 Tax=Aphis gossypii TaxID=80765 RepID=A0A9P0J7G9_APHGO|nr:unnamed protein product [Aphis gossypii]